MKYVVKLRKTIVQETVIEVDCKGKITEAMDFAETVMEVAPAKPGPTTTTTESEWKVISINTKGKQ